jgi:hypothetical protein
MLFLRRSTCLRLKIDQGLRLKAGGRWQKETKEEETFPFCLKRYKPLSLDIEKNEYLIRGSRSDELLISASLLNPLTPTMGIT